jgi:TRAP-type uncharacterized transport system fused permease subunit
MDLRRLLAPDMPERRSLSGGWSALVKAIGVSFALSYIYFAFTFVDFSFFLSLYFGFTGVLAFLCWPAGQTSPRERPSAPDIALALLTTITVAWYVGTNEERVASAGGAVAPLELAFGCLAIVLSIEMCRRIMGLVLPMVAVALIGYNLFGSGLPGILAHNGIAFSQFVSFVFSEEGIFGVVTSTCKRQVSASCSSISPSDCSVPPAAARERLPWWPADFWAAFWGAGRAMS